MALMKRGSQCEAGERMEKGREHRPGMMIAVGVQRRAGRKMRGVPFGRKISENALARMKR